MTTRTRQRQFKNSHGRTVTLRGMCGGNVMFMRPSYPHPCQQPLEKFKAEFTEVTPCE
ncbi:DUF4222 domain-containing protein [Erwinia amylovora]|uniref:DUF4222 domain-containing protein n=1 Tax=Erwinia amylovora TaxID=552 RepID=UPI0014442243|nr:DUF4222 domain-containing protein [Erwinia amylovora]